MLRTTTLRDSPRLLWARSRLEHPRFLQAVKISIAVAVAWLLSPLVPGDAQQMRYYAPLGALLSMHPTLMRSLRSTDALTN